ncbi:MAG: site-2 protease family protein [Patescibacteria group bacterium]
MSIDFIFSIAVLIMSVVVHEVAHGVVANRLGDPTARLAGRLTLNPVSHLDLFGSILLPFLSYQIGGVLFGWAKPVPVNIYNLKYGKWSEAIVAFAGPLSNIILAVVFGLAFRLSMVLYPNETFLKALSVVVLINLVLAILNLIPLPPLDGSKILGVLVPYKYYNFHIFYERYALILTVLVVFYLWRFIAPIIPFFFKLITGVPLL